MPQLRLIPRRFPNQNIIKLFGTKWCSEKNSFVEDGPPDYVFPDTMLGRIHAFLLLEHHNNSRVADEITNRIEKHMNDIGQPEKVPERFRPQTEKIDNMKLLLSC